MPKTPTVADLTRQWYEALAREGFRDIETASGLLTTAGSKRVDPDQIDRYEVQAEYYRAAGQFLFEHHFGNDLEARIWELHAEGRSVREIERETGSYRRHVHETIQRLQAQMKGLTVTVRRRGRPKEPGRGRGCWEARARLDDATAEAFIATTRRIGKSTQDILRVLISEFVRASNSGTTVH